VLLELKALGSLGPFLADFLNVENTKGIRCNTPLDPKGEVFVTGEWHLVPISTTPLVNGIAFLLGSLVLITCGTEKIDLKGCALAKTSATETKDLTELAMELGSNGKGQALQREYLNDVPQSVKCILQAEVVATKIVREAAERINEGKPITLTIGTGSVGTMFFITGL
jgi:hypothetical protein